MLDQIYNLNAYSRNLCDVKLYTVPTSANSASGYQVWQKPRGATMVYMTCIGGGGGGGAGATGASGQRGGGGGGASSGISKFYCNAMFLPDSLYVSVGSGGQGGSGSLQSGSAGQNSYVLLSPNINPSINSASIILCMSNNILPGGGAPGNGATAGVGGRVPTIAIAQPFHCMGIFTSLVGITGASGGAGSGATGGAITAWGTSPLSPGAGGAGTNASNQIGGAVTPTAVTNFVNKGYFPAAIAMALGGTTGVSVNGSAGVSKLTPGISCGGAGGGALTGGAGGHGGNGGFGSGGGGGGAGTTGGKGGNGGNGLVLIISW